MLITPHATPSRWHADAAVFASHADIDAMIVCRLRYAFRAFVFRYALATYRFFCQMFCVYATTGHNVGNTEHNVTLPLPMPLFPPLLIFIAFLRYVTPIIFLSMRFLIFTPLIYVLRHCFAA